MRKRFCHANFNMQTLKKGRKQRRLCLSKKKSNNSESHIPGNKSIILQLTVAGGTPWPLFSHVWFHSTSLGPNIKIYTNLIVRRWFRIKKHPGLLYICISLCRCRDLQDNFPLRWEYRHIYIGMMCIRYVFIFSYIWLYYLHMILWD